MKRDFEKEQDYTINHIRNFLDDKGKERDWDTYTSISFRNPTFESIRKRASRVDLPIDDDGEHILISLLHEAETALPT